MVHGSVAETLNALPARGGADPPAVVYTYAPVSRRRAVRRLCSVQEGARDRITVAFCWSRLRREFFKIAERGNAPIATKPSRALARSTPSRRTCAAHDKCRARASVVDRDCDPFRWHASCSLRA
jgi:hypothetical protein